MDRWETLDHRRKQNHRIGAYLETRAENVAERTIQAVEKVQDTIDSINKEAKCTRKTQEKLLGTRKALGSSTQKDAIAHESRKLAEEEIAVAEFAFASPREPPDRISPGLDTLENAKESPSDVDTMVLEREAMPSRVKQVQSCRCDRSIRCSLEHASTVELLWLPLWTGTNSRCG